MNRHLFNNYNEHFSDFWKCCFTIYVTSLQQPSPYIKQFCEFPVMDGIGRLNFIFVYSDNSFSSFDQRDLTNSHILFTKQINKFLKHSDLLYKSTSLRMVEPLICCLKF